MLPLTAAVAAANCISPPCNLFLFATQDVLFQESVVAHLTPHPLCIAHNLRLFLRLTEQRTEPKPNPN